MRKPGGTVCVVRGCKNITTEKSVVFFRFPKESERIEQWLEVCRRQDLLEKSRLALYNNYRVCASHFEDRMYANDLKNRLLPSAVPTIFPFSNDAKQIFHESRNIFIVLDKTYASSLASQEVEEYAVSSSSKTEDHLKSSPCSSDSTRNSRSSKKLETRKTLQKKRLEGDSYLDSEEDKKKLSKSVKVQARLHAKRKKTL